MRLFIAFAATLPALQFIFNDHLYHLYYGLLIGVFALFLGSLKIAPVLFGIGAGLVIDDLGVLKYLLIAPAMNPIQEYWSALFVVPLLSGILFFLLTERRIELFFNRTRQGRKEKNKGV